MLDIPTGCFGLQSDDQEHHVAHRPAKRSRTASHDGGTKAAHAHQHAAATQVQETAPAAEKMDMDEPPAEQHHSQDRLDAGTEADEAERADRRTSREGLGSTPFAAGALENIFPSAAGGARTSSHGAEDAAVGEAVAAAGEDAAGGGLKPRHSSRPHKDSQRLEASTSGRSMSKQASLMQQHSGGPPKRPKKGAAATQTRAVWQGEDDNWGQGGESQLLAALAAAAAWCLIAATMSGSTACAGSPDLGCVSSSLITVFLAALCACRSNALSYAFRCSFYPRSMRAGSACTVIARSVSLLLLICSSCHVCA